MLKFIINSLGRLFKKTYLYGFFKRKLVLLLGLSKSWDKNELFKQMAAEMVAEGFSILQENWLTGA